MVVTFYMCLLSVVYKEKVTKVTGFSIILIVTSGLPNPYKGGAVPPLMGG